MKFTVEDLKIDTKVLLINHFWDQIRRIVTDVIRIKVLASVTAFPPETIALLNFETTPTLE